MNNHVKVIFLAALLIFVIGGSYYLYQNLSANMGADTTEAAGPPSSTSADSQPPTTPSDVVTPAVTGNDAQTQAAPDFTVYDVSGNEVTLSSFLGKPIVVNFWASWCTPCQSELPDFQTAYEEYGQEVNFVMVNLNGGGNDSMEDAQALLSSHDYSFPVYYDTDSAAAIAYGIRSIPLSCFITAEGNIQSTNTGIISKENLTSEIKALLTTEK